MWFGCCVVGINRSALREECYVLLESLVSSVTVCVIERCVYV